MEDVPAVSPVTIPEADPIDATEVVPLVQVPPVETSLRLLIPPPAHITAIPVIPAGIGFTVTTAVTYVLQPEPFVTL
jgi:hypothetical protein